MGLRFKKSVKIAPGVKVNLNKKSAGITVGPKGSKVTVNTKGRKTVSVGVPGSGLSYTKSSDGTSSNKKAVKSTSHSSNSGVSNNAPNNKKPKFSHTTAGIILWLIFFFPVGLYFMWKYSCWSKNIKTCISAFFGIMVIFNMITTTDPPEAIDFTIVSVSDTYDINCEIPISITVTPSDFETSLIEYDASDSSIQCDGNTINTGDVEGTFTIYAYYDDIKSSVLEITVVDYVAEAERIAEEQALIEAEEEAAKLAEEEAARLAEEEATRLAEEEALAQEALTEEEASTETVESDEPLVWIPTISGTKYHRSSTCSSMIDPEQVTLSEAEALGFDPCGRCY